MHDSAIEIRGLTKAYHRFQLGPLDLTVPLLDLPPTLAAQARGPERDPNNPLIRQVGENYLKGRLRSHPDVARRHYADLVGGGTADEAH